MESTHWNPVSKLSKDDFPAPDGPIIAVSSPELKFPFNPFSTCFLSATKKERILKLD